MDALEIPGSFRDDTAGCCRKLPTNRFIDRCRHSNDSLCLHDMSFESRGTAVQTGEPKIARSGYVRLWHLADIDFGPEYGPLRGAKRTSLIRSSSWKQRKTRSSPWTMTFSSAL